MVVYKKTASMVWAILTNKFFINRKKKNEEKEEESTYSSPFRSNTISNLIIPSPKAPSPKIP